MDKNEFVEQLLNWIQTPLRPGESPPFLSQEQIDALYSAPDTTTAAQFAIELGLGEYVTIIGRQLPSEFVDDEEAWRQAIGQNIANPTKFIGVDPAQKIVYQGEDTTIDKYAGNFYQIGDNNTFVDLEPQEIRNIQADLVNAGLLGKKAGREFRPGFWNPDADGEAMKDIMTLANIMGVGKAENGWKQALRNYINNPLPSYTNIQPYLPPNYDSISQDVKGLFRQRLGRDPKPYEVQLLYDAYDSEAKKMWSTQSKEYDLPDATPVTLDLYATEFDPSVYEDIGEQIDPGAEMLSTFDNITRKEQEAVQAGQDIQDSRNRIINSIIRGKQLRN